MSNVFVKNNDKPISAGLDISTGHGVDSFFINSDGLQDPWASECTEIFIDTVINHQKVFYPLPSDEAIGSLQPDLLPKIFVEGEKFNYIESKKELSAEQINFTIAQLEIEYSNFCNWSIANSLSLNDWIRFQRNTPHIAKQYKKHVPNPPVNQFWSDRIDKNLTTYTGIPDDDLRYAFDVFARSIQYHKLLGENTIYFSHPLRENAFYYLPVIAQFQKRWSWGKYLVNLIKSREEFRNPGWVLEELESIRLSIQKYNATWYSMDIYSEKSKIDLLITVAAESGLPATLKDSIKKKIKTVLDISSIVTNINHPIVSITLKLSAIGVDYWKGEIPSNLVKIPIFKGLLTWPGLVK